MLTKYSYISIISKGRSIGSLLQIRSNFNLLLWNWQGFMCSSIVGFIERV